VIEPVATLQAFVEHFAEHFTYLGIFVLLLLGSLGVPIPEELPIITAGVLSRQGIVRWWLALSICVLGVLSGDVILYWVGRHWGDRVLNWRVLRRRLTPQRAQWLTEAYRRHAVKTIIMARHIMGLRAAAFLTAGIARVSFRKFIAADAGAALLGVPFGFGLAYCFADRVDAIFADVHRVERWLVLGGLIFLAFVLGVSGWRWTRRAENRMLATVNPGDRQGSVPVPPRRWR
jgi:membrane protein DedA with SNARE-associated domain